MQIFTIKAKPKVIFGCVLANNRADCYFAYLYKQSQHLAVRTDYGKN